MDYDLRAILLGGGQVWGTDVQGGGPGGPLGQGKQALLSGVGTFVHRN